MPYCKSVAIHGHVDKTLSYILDPDKTEELLYTSSINCMTEADLARVEKGKPAAVGFDRKVEIDKAFLDSVKEADITQRDFLPYADELFIVHGTKDEIVPFDAVKAFAENNVIEFTPVENADHRFQSPEKMDFAITKICAFFGLK